MIVILTLYVDAQKMRAHLSFLVTIRFVFLHHEQHGIDSFLDALN